MEPTATRGIQTAHSLELLDSQIRLSTSPAPATMTQRDAKADSEFGPTATPDWDMTEKADDSDAPTLSDDPFATAGQSAAALPAIDEFAFTPAASFDTSSSVSAAAAAVASSSSSSIVPAIPLADSAEYIAALEKRLARLHTRPAKKEFAHRPAGAEFLSAASGSGAAAAGSWLDLPDSVPAVAAGSSSAAAASSAMGHSSDEEAEDEGAADRHRLASAMLHAAVEERVALLTQHQQLMDDDDCRQLEEARRLANTQTATMGSAGAEEPSITAPASSPSSVSSAVPAPAAPPAPVPASHRIESSDGDDTDAPAHVHMTSAPGADEGAALQSGALPLRALYYSSSACLAHAAGWWEEKQEKCTIS